MVELVVFCILMDEGSDLIKKLHSSLQEYGFTYMHADQINNFNNPFKSILNYDIVNISNSEKYMTSANVVYLKEHSNGIILMVPNRYEKKSILELSLYSKNQEGIKLLKSKLDSILFSKEIKLEKKSLFYGSISEIKYVNTLKQMKDHSRSKMLKTIDNTFLEPFLNSELRKKIKTFASFPIASPLPMDFLIAEAGLNDTEISNLLSVNVICERYTIYCTKCCFVE